MIESWTIQQFNGQEESNIEQNENFLVPVAFQIMGDSHSARNAIL